MYIVTEKCLVAIMPVTLVAEFTEKKKAVRFKNRLSASMNTHNLYTGFKYKVIKA